MTIPKIIHQTAPKNMDEWHPIWEKCHSSWKYNFPKEEYTHLMWNDDDMDSFVKTEYPEYWDFYKNLCMHILQIDFFRYLVLYKLGGIYADMDMYCYKNFYDDLNSDCCIVESSSPDLREFLQNSLMVSSIGNVFFYNCILKFIEIYSPIDGTLNDTETQNWVRKTSGPIFLSDVYKFYQKDLIQILPSNEYNVSQYFINTKTRHMLSGRWGKEMMDILKERHSDNEELNEISHKDYLVIDYKKFRGIDSNSFNPYV